MYAPTPPATDAELAAAEERIGAAKRAFDLAAAYGDDAELTAAQREYWGARSAWQQIYDQLHPFNPDEEDD